MSSNILSKCKMAPELGHDERIKTSLSVGLGDVIRDNIVVVLTDNKLFVRPKKGRKVASELKDKSNFEVRLSDIQALRLQGTVTKNLEIETKDEVYGIDSIPNGAKDLVKEIVEIEGLEKSQWGQESSGKKAGKGLLGTALAALGIGAGGLAVVMGIGLILIGLLMTLTIVGALAGIPLMIVGYMIAFGGGVMGIGGAKGGSWGFNSEKEWKRPNKTKKNEEIHED